VFFAKEKEVEKLLIEKAMMVESVDLPSFRKAADKTHDGLKIAEPSILSTDPISFDFSLLSKV
jgi:hypothetical protein